jgi:solute:Na+ symporter, SSS family
MWPLIIIIIYLALLLGLGLFSAKSFRGTSKDYFVASQSIGPFLLLMSVFGTTMTAFALVGSTGKSFERGIGVYGLMASSSGLIHAACFFLIGVRLWTYGKKHGYVTQIQFFRARFESDALGYLLFPILVGLVIPYLLIGVIGAGKTIQPATAGAFPGLFDHASPILNGGIPPWLSGLVVCLIVVTYVFLGGSRGAAWANTFQTLVFMVMGLVAFLFISNALGGLSNAGNVVLEATSDGKLVQNYAINMKEKKLVELPEPKEVGTIRLGGEHAEDENVEGGLPKQPHLARKVTTAAYYKTHETSGEKDGVKFKRGDVVKDVDGNPIYQTKKVDGETKIVHVEHGIPPIMFLTYMFIPLSVGMFPHLFQHWLTAKSAKSFRLTLIAHPLFILIVWVPCVLIGAWATGVLGNTTNPAAVLSIMVKGLVGSPVLVGLLTAGVLAAIMSSLDSQFLCMGTIFTNDIVLHKAGHGKYSDKQIIWIARGFTVGIVAVTYVLAMVAMANDANVFDLAVWCFSGFGALFPLVFAAVFWKRATKQGAFACIIAVMVTWFGFFWASGFGGEYTVAGGVMPAAICFAAGAVAMIVVSLLTPPPSVETLEKFFPKKA